MSEQALVDDVLARVREVVRGGLSVEGYEFFYELVLNKPVPKHVSGWVRDVIAAWRAGKPLLAEAFRGSTKTTAITQILGAYLIGLEPHKTGLVVQAGDDIARDNAKNVATIIEHNPGWRALFSEVVPDKQMGWGDEGYWVKRTDMDYGDWTRLRADKDPTFVGYGYTSSAIIGKHPSNFLFIDDILNEENTRSGREQDHVKRVYSGTIWPTRDPGNPLTVVSFTPWTDNDVYADAKRTGMYAAVRTPVYTEAGGTPPGVAGAPVWPEMMPRDKVEQKRKEDITGGVEFARMYLLDLTAMAKRVFKYHLYPAHLINTSWPMGGGVDFAEANNPMQRDSGHSHFAMAYLAKLPEGGAVVFDGVLEQWSQAEGENAVVRGQAMFPNWSQSVIEGDGKGETFFNMLYQKPEMKVYMLKSGGKSKADRLVNGLGPWLESGRLRVSSGESKFLDKLRDFMNKYPAVDKHHPGWDAMDSVYWAARGMPEVLVMPKAEGAAPSIWGEAAKAKHSSPFSEFGKQHA